MNIFIVTGVADGGVELIIAFFYIAFSTVIIYNDSFIIKKKVHPFYLNSIHRI